LTVAGARPEQQIQSFLLQVTSPATSPSSSESIQKVGGDSNSDSGQTGINAEIRQIDFANFRYSWYPKDTVSPDGRRSLALVKGEFETDGDRKRGIEPLTVKLEDVRYDDLTGDGRDEAVVILSGIETFNSFTGVIFVFSLDEHKLTRLWQHETGDRADGGLRSLTVDRGLLVLEEYVLNSEYGNGGLCCPRAFRRSTFEYAGKGLRLVRSTIEKNEFPNAKVLGYFSK
jgi:hypothetical protein